MPTDAQILRRYVRPVVSNLGKKDERHVGYTLSLPKKKMKEEVMTNLVSSITGIQWFCRTFQFNSHDKVFESLQESQYSSVTSKWEPLYYPSSMFFKEYQEAVEFLKLYFSCIK